MGNILKINDIVKFLLTAKKNSNDLFLSDMLSFTDEEMENKHDYIQWMFPIDTKSKFVIDAPVVTKTQIENHHMNYDFLLRQNLKKSFTKYLTFLFRTSNVWLKERDHNFLRISRVLRCMHLFEMKSEYNILMGFCTFLNDKYPQIIGESYKFWLETNK